jgi:hypothetical protein
MPIPFLSLRRDAQTPRRGRIAERTLNLGGEDEIRRYAYDSAGRLARVADGSGGLLESYQYDGEGRRLADINPHRFRGERRYSYNLGNRLGQAGAMARLASAEVSRLPHSRKGALVHGGEEHGPHVDELKAA